MNLVLALAILLNLAPAGVATTVSQGSANVRSVALTFDAGADRGYAAAILTTLERNHIHATFGMTGLWAKANPGLLKRMARDGDPFIDHTYDHRSFTGFSTRTAPLTTAQRIWEIQQAAHIIYRETGKSPKPYFRPPYGDYDQATLTLLPRLGYRYMIMWTIDTLGWDHLPAAGIVKRCLELVKPGAIIAMHVGSQSQDALALQSVITDLRRDKYAFVTIPQLVSGVRR